MPRAQDKLFLRPEFTPLELGMAIYEARLRGVPMKELGRQYGYGRCRLWQLQKLAMASINATKVEGALPS